MTCQGLHCKCMDPTCPEPHNGDHDCPFEATSPSAHCGGHYAETGTVGTREGHQFHFSVATQGEGADWIGEPFAVTVRAWSLSAACTKASAIPLADWTHPPEDDDEPVTRRIK